MYAVKYGKRWLMNGGLAVSPHLYGKPNEAEKGAKRFEKRNPNMAEFREVFMLVGDTLVRC